MQQKSVVEMGKMFLTCVFWSLWKTRNRACFVNVMPHFFIIDAYCSKQVITSGICTTKMHTAVHKCEEPQVLKQTKNRSTYQS
jgi:hypothetical protein